MQRHPFSVPTSAWRLPLKQTLEQIHQLGVQGVQFDLRSELTPREFGDTARRELLHNLRERKLQLAAGQFPLRRPLASEEALDERMAALRAAIAFAAQLRIRNIVTSVGPLPAAEDGPGRALLLELLRELASAGNRAGVTLAIAPGGNSSESMEEFLQQVDTGPVGIYADLAGWVLQRRSPAAELGALRSRVIMIEARDAAPDLGGLGHETPLGRGAIDWDEIAGVLSDLDPGLWLHVNRTSGPDPVGDIARGVQYLRNVLSGT